MTWKTESLQPERFSQAHSTEEVRLTLRGGETLLVQSPLIIGDSLVGMRARVGSPDSLERVSIPVAAIEKVEIYAIDTAVTVATVVFGSALILAMKLIVEALIPCIVNCPSVPRTLRVPALQFQNQFHGRPAAERVAGHLRISRRKSP